MAAAVLAFCGWSVPASAITVGIAQNLSLIQSPPGTSQPDTGFCVIGEPSASCGTLLPTAGNPTEYLDIYSPSYSVETLTNAIGGTEFSIGIDINNAVGSPTDHTLVHFVMEYSSDGGTSWTQAFAWDTVSILTVINAGTGESDWQLNGFSLAALLLTDTVRFGLDMTGVSGGREQFFTLFSENVSPVPLPAALPLFGAGFLGLSFAGWRRKRREGRDASAA